MADLYNILGISQTASDQEIKKAFRSLAKMYHPDKNIGDDYADERFKQINAAYQTLSDRIKKAQYDAVLNYQRVQAAQPRQPNYTSYSPNHTQSHPNQAEVKPLTPYQLQQMAKRKKANHIKAFNRMAVFLTIFLLGFGSVVLVIESERAAEEERIVLQRNQRREEIKYWLSIYDESMAVKAFEHAYHANSELRQFGSSFFEVNEYKINQLVVIEGDAAYDNDNFKLAKDRYELFLKHNFTNNNVIYLRIARCYLQEGNLSEAERAFTETCDNLLDGYATTHGQNFYYNMNPEFVEEYHFEAFIGKGISSFLNKNYLKSKTALTFAKFLRPKNAIVYQYLAQVEEEIGNTQMSEINKKLAKQFEKEQSTSSVQ
jgi:curved DNA-binding protein CbpA